MVVFVVHEVDRAARDRTASIEHGPVHVHPVESLAAKRGQEGRMDVDHPADEIPRDPHEMEEARHDYQLSPSLPTGREYLLAPDRELLTAWG